MSIVAIGHNDKNIEKSIIQALDELDIKDIIEGKIVAIKPNDTYADSANMSGVTRGDTLRAVIRYIKSFNPKKIVATGGAGAEVTYNVFKITGMLDALNEEKVEFFDHNTYPFEEVRLDFGPQKTVMVNPRIFEYETLISLAQHKLHATATVTLCLKNVAMSYPAANYYGHPRSSMSEHEHHMFDDLQRFIVAMIKRFPIQLGIIVGHPSMIGSGPLEGKAVETGLTIASKDAVAADAVGAKLFGFNHQAVRHIFEAGKLGIGKSDIRDIEIKGVPLEEAIRIFTKKAYGEELYF
ncbi:MAG: hypothetical protein A2287_11120 [Candidatus Melainabacteria bacterium RIFOXYA12_FULL_32_12]|nr:MAG: hypothetical protein A2255_00995 [Candidatus Melainabacteria bacterium RIFOXYA2_FULL_32_9]OGI29800.1 MAG: hypothetical protein A2287_11120 [Candidatus Melainabacteria bacterium RIFOXYA12_FULL_32_12]